MCREEEIAKRITCVDLTFRGSWFEAAVRKLGGYFLLPYEGFARRWLIHLGREGPGASKILLDEWGFWVSRNQRVWHQKIRMSNLSEIAHNFYGNLWGCFLKEPCIALTVLVSLVFGWHNCSSHVEVPKDVVIIEILSRFRAHNKKCEPHMHSFNQHMWKCMRKRIAQCAFLQPAG